MTGNYLPGAAPPQRGETWPPASADEPSTADVVRDQASDLSHSGVQAGKHEPTLPGRRRSGSSWRDIASTIGATAQPRRSETGRSGSAASPDVRSLVFARRLVGS
jgi:hypothetical protein